MLGRELRLGIALGELLGAELADGWWDVEGLALGVLLGILLGRELRLGTALGALLGAELADG